ncbi:MAG: hypothetical protein IJ676_05865 [Clostridia bacterium]|nr:hypothetical protein [Clostridia bacterium]
MSPKYKLLIIVILIIFIFAAITCIVLYCPRKMDKYIKSDEKIVSISLSYLDNMEKQDVSYELKGSRYNEFIKEASNIKFRYWYNLKRLREWRTTQNARYRLKYEKHIVLFDKYHYYLYDKEGNILTHRHITVIDEEEYLNLEKFFS